MFSSRLRSARNANSYTQQRMSDMLGITLNSYQKYEQGTRCPSFDLLVQIADILDVSIDYLLGRDEWLASHGVSFDELP